MKNKFLDSLKNTRSVFSQKSISLGVYFFLLGSLGTFISLAGCQHSSLAMKDAKSSASLSSKVLVPQYELTQFQITSQGSQPGAAGKAIGQFQGQSIFWGGFSSLALDPHEENVIWTITDRGPNGDTQILDFKGQKIEARQFLLPKFSPSILKIRLNKNNPDSRSAEIVQEILLQTRQGTKALGLPQWNQKSGGPDEVALDEKNKQIKESRIGFDTEGLAIDGQGNFWASEEYRPSLIKMDSHGRIQRIFIPKESLPKNVLQRLNHKEALFSESLPGDYHFRKTNRGFEGLCFAQGHLFAALQSPLDQPGMMNRSVIRILEFDTEAQKPINEFLLPIPVIGSEKLDKLGDLTFSTKDNKFYVILQNSKTGSEGIHNIYSFQLAQPLGALTPELMSLKELEKRGFLPKLNLEVELTKAGFDFEKNEGISVDSAGNIFVSNDNDFGIQTTADQGLHISADKKSFIGVLKKATP